MTDNSRLNRIMNRLNRAYPDQRILLHYRNPFELTMSVALSAQTTDAAVNRATPELFSRWPNPESLAEAAQNEVEKVIHSLGFFRQKARNLIASARLLKERFGGEVPQAMEQLTSLPGIGRKSANVIRGHIWSLPGIIVDTHFGRVSRRLGLTEQMDPVKVELELASMVPEARHLEFSMTVNLHGRHCCLSRKPRCASCFLSRLCPYGSDKNDAS